MNALVSLYSDYNNLSSFQFNGLKEQLTYSICDKYSPVVHQILANAAQAKGEKQGSKVRVVKSKRADEMADMRALDFVDRLTSAVGEWIKWEDVQQIDRQIQEFVAQIAQGNLSIKHSN
jgi:hypothetical protein